MKNLRPSELISFVLLSLAICLGGRHELMAQEMSHMPAFRDRACVTAEQVVQNLVRMNAERAEALQAYEGTRVYRLDYRGFPASRRAEMVVRVKYRSPLTKDFTVVSATGSKLVIEKVFQKLLQAEKEALREDHERLRHSTARITPSSCSGLSQAHRRMIPCTQSRSSQRPRTNFFIVGQSG